MRSRFSIVPVFLFSTLLFAGFFSPPAFSKDNYKPGEKLRINVSETRMKSSPMPFGGEMIKVLPRGTTVSYMGEDGAWLKVDHDGDKGYIPAKSLVEAKKFSSFSRTAEVTESDMAAATKGFSPEVEDQNRKNQNIRYDLMDKAEEQSTVANPVGELKTFREEGRLGEYK